MFSSTSTSFPTYTLLLLLFTPIHINSLTLTLTLTLTLIFSKIPPKMDIGTALSVVQTLLAALQCSQLKHFCSKKSVSSQLDQLEATVKRIHAVLLDAEAKLVLSKHEEVYIEELKEVLYEADDLFDELVTLAQQKKLNDGAKDRLLSFSNKFIVDYKISQKVEKIKIKLDGIASRNELVSFKHDPQPLKMRSRETCSYVHAVDIIGRDDDLEKIVALLLQSHGKEFVSFLSIVGIGGLGKTALAQLVFNDPRVASAFPMKLWTCVSDQDQQDFDETEILRKILDAATKQKHHDDTKDRIQCILRQELEGKKYLLVLDDLWTENREQWCKLEQFLMGGQRESWVLVTTRSKRTAGIVGDGSVHELKGLSQENSWCLFERVAFGPVPTNPPQELVSIGQKIVEKCANVPLAIRVAGSLLYGQDKRKWLCFQELPLTKFEDSKSGIMPILKLSYHQLESPLKSCFGYCALFPKDYVLSKATLIELWKAQGYIPSNDEQSMEDVAEEYFLVLLRRCFFQDVEEDQYGEIESCKIHDLMHDVAQELVGKEICRVDAITDMVGKNVRHISTIKPCKSYTFNKTRIRSYLQLHPNRLEFSNMDRLSVNALLDNWKYLRVLDLSYLNINSLPNSIGKLIHLRYLDLSSNYKLEFLPKQITKLYNLEILKLSLCFSLKELPKDINKLVKLRALWLYNCDGLSYIPRSITKLSCLKVLNTFVVGEVNCSPEKLSNALEDLKLLRILEGYLYIKIGYCKKDEKVEKNGGREGGCLSNKPHLTYVRLNFSFSEEECEGRVESDEALIGDLQPHSNLKSLYIAYYLGVRMPKWAREDTFPNLVYLYLNSCVKLQCLGCLGTLKHLKSLSLYNLREMEWLYEKRKTIEDNSERGASLSTSKALHEISLFPSLENLILSFIPKLTGWWRGVGYGDDHQLLWLPRLKELRVHNCPNLTAIIACPPLESLHLRDFNKKLGIRLEIKEKRNGKHILGEGTIPKGRIEVDDVSWLISKNIDKEAFECLKDLIIYDKEMESLGESGELFHNISSTLRSLSLSGCCKLKNVSGGLEYLTALEILEIYNCYNLRLSEGGERNLPWQSLNHSLRTLRFNSLPQLVNLPSWMQYLTALQNLQISSCEQLESLPNWMPKLTSLRELDIISCAPHLKQRCQPSTGADWPYIQHIPSIAIEASIDD